MDDASLTGHGGVRPHGRKVRSLFPFDEVPFERTYAIAASKLEDLKANEREVDSKWLPPAEVRYRPRDGGTLVAYTLDLNDPSVLAEASKVKVVAPSALGAGATSSSSSSTFPSLTLLGATHSILPLAAPATSIAADRSTAPLSPLAAEAENMLLLSGAEERVGKAVERAEDAGRVAGVAAETALDAALRAIGAATQAVQKAVEVSASRKDRVGRVRAADSVPRSSSTGAAASAARTPASAPAPAPIPALVTQPRAARADVGTSPFVFPPSALAFLPTLPDPPTLRPSITPIAQPATTTTTLAPTAATTRRRYLDESTQTAGERDVGVATEEEGFGEFNRTGVTDGAPPALVLAPVPVPASAPTLTSPAEADIQPARVFSPEDAADAISPYIPGMWGVTDQPGAQPRSGFRSARAPSPGNDDGEVDDDNEGESPVGFPAASGRAAHTRARAPAPAADILRICSPGRMRVGGRGHSGGTTIEMPSRLIENRRGEVAIHIHDGHDGAGPDGNGGGGGGGGAQVKVHFGAENAGASAASLTPSGNAAVDSLAAWPEAAAILGKLLLAAASKEKEGGKGAKTEQIEAAQSRPASPQRSHKPAQIADLAPRAPSAGPERFQLRSSFLIPAAPAPALAASFATPLDRSLVETTSWDAASALPPPPSARASRVSSPSRIAVPSLPPPTPERQGQGAATAFAAAPTTGATASSLLLARARRQLEEMRVSLQAASSIAAVAKAGGPFSPRGGGVASSASSASSSSSFPPSSARPTGW
jgi:hypothetical protein